MQVSLFGPACPRFDVVVVNMLMGNEPGYYLAHRFGAQLALLVPGQVMEIWNQMYPY